MDLFCKKEQVVDLFMRKNLIADLFFEKEQVVDLFMRKNQVVDLFFEKELVVDLFTRKKEFEPADLRCCSRDVIQSS